MDSVLDALRAPDPDLPEVDEKVGHFIALAREIHRAAEVVALEGPDTVTAAADRVTHSSQDLSHVMRRMVDDARAGDRTRRAEHRELATAREHDLYQAVQGFRHAARTAVGNAH